MMPALVEEPRWTAVGNATASAKSRSPVDEGFKWINPNLANTERGTDYFFNTSWARDGVTVWRWVSEVALFRAARAAVRRARASSAAPIAPIARAWSVGCSSGEEGFTLRFLWLAVVEPILRAAGLGDGLVPALHVLGTDRSAERVSDARAGAYTRRS